MPINYQMGYDCAKRGQTYTSAGLTFKPVTTSTMDDIDIHIPYHQDDGHTVIALHQTQGKGSQNRRWESGGDNLMFSRKLWIDPHEYGQEMEMIAACAVRDVLRDLLPTADIVVKHPNDVLIDGMKICGCLVYPRDDAPDKIGKRRAVNLGVGVNLATAPHTSQATTCLEDHGENIGLVAFMQKFDAAFAAIHAAYRADKDFNIVLRHAEFLAQNSNILTLYSPSGQIITTGTYAGFVSHDGVNHLKLNDGAQHPLRSFDLQNTAQRQRSHRHPTQDEPVPPHA